MPRGLLVGQHRPLVARTRRTRFLGLKTSVRQLDGLSGDVLCRARFVLGCGRVVYPSLSAGLPGLLGAVLARSEAHVLRLASLYALLDRSSTIRRDHLESALALWDYAERSARFIFGASLGDPLADELLAHLRQRPEGVTRTEIRDLFVRHAQRSQIDRALSTLRANGLARVEKTPTGGRPEERWFASGPPEQGEAGSPRGAAPSPEPLPSLPSRENATHPESSGGAA